jgi:YD repeat-containing protein
MKKQIWCLCLFPAMAIAEVNMQTASFIQKQNDFKSPVMIRTYNSRSLWFGIFGFGWCSEFERQLDPIHQRLTHCDREAAAVIQAKNDRWVVTEISTDSKYKKQTYNFRGQLMQIMDSSGLSWSLNYDSQGRLSRIHSRKASFALTYQGQHLQKIEASKDPPATYQWNGNLLTETNSFIGITRYRYNDLMNLTEIEIGHRKRTQINYDDEQDRVRQVKIGGCEQNFRFLKKTNKSFQSTATTRCPSQAMQTQTFTFTARKGKYETISSSTVDP